MSLFRAVAPRREDVDASNARETGHVDCSRLAIGVHRCHVELEAALRCGLRGRGSGNCEQPKQRSERGDVRPPSSGRLLPIRRDSCLIRLGEAAGPDEGVVAGHKVALPAELDRPSSR